LLIDVEDTEARHDYAGEGQQQFNLPTDRPEVDSWSNDLLMRQLADGNNGSTEAENIVEIRHQATTGAEISY
jgi:hypothetical protein